MTVKELLQKQLNLPSKEITQRFITGQVKLNGVKLSNPDFELTKKDYVTELHDLGDFLLNECSGRLNLLQLLSPDVRLLFGTLDNESINIESLKFLANWNVLQVSKKESWVFKNEQITSL